MATRSVPAMMGRFSEEDDLDWEYEYHDTETESFYVILDLSSAATREKYTGKRQATASKSNSLSPAPDLVDGGVEGRKNSPHHPQEDDRVQILDVHSLNPLVSYRDQVYSCQWSSTIGTDILITESGLPLGHAALKQLQGFDMLGTSNIKLVGRPSQLVLSKKMPALELTHEAGLATEPMEKNNATAAALFNISRDPHSSIERQAQAHFLERLIAAKTAKGETDSVTVGIAKYEGEDLLGREARNLTGERTPAEDVNAKIVDRQATVVSARRSRPTSRATTGVAGRTRRGYTIGRPKRDRLPGSDRRPTIGDFFTDHRPSLGDTDVTYSTRAPDSTSTPKSWNDLKSFAEATPHNGAAPDPPASVDVPSSSQAIPLDSYTIADQIVSVEDGPMIDG